MDRSCSCSATQRLAAFQSPRSIRTCDSAAALCWVRLRAALCVGDSGCFRKATRDRSKCPHCAAPSAGSERAARRALLWHSFACATQVAAPPTKTGWKCCCSYPARQWRAQLPLPEASTQLTCSCWWAAARHRRSFELRVQVLMRMQLALRHRVPYAAGGPAAARCRARASGKSLAIHLLRASLSES